MDTEDWVFKCTKLTTNTKKQRLKIYSRGWIFKNTILKKRRTTIKKKKTSRELLKNNNNHHTHTQIYIYTAFALKIWSFFLKSDSRL